MAQRAVKAERLTADLNFPHAVGDVCRQTRYKEKTETDRAVVPCVGFCLF